MNEWGKTALDSNKKTPLHPKVRKKKKSRVCMYSSRERPLSSPPFLFFSFLSNHWPCTALKFPRFWNHCIHVYTYISVMRYKRPGPALVITHIHVPEAPPLLFNLPYPGHTHTPRFFFFENELLRTHTYSFFFFFFFLNACIHACISRTEANQPAK